MRLDHLDRQALEHAPGHAPLFSRSESSSFEDTVELIIPYSLILEMLAPTSWRLGAVYNHCD